MKPISFLSSARVLVTFQQQRGERDQRGPQAGDQVSVGFVVPGRVLQEKKVKGEHHVSELGRFWSAQTQDQRGKLTAMLSNCWNCFLNFPGRPWEHQRRFRYQNQRIWFYRRTWFNRTALSVLLKTRRVVPPRWAAACWRPGCPDPEPPPGRTAGPAAVYSWNRAEPGQFMAWTTGGSRELQRSDAIQFNLNTDYWSFIPDTDHSIW